MECKSSLILHLQQQQSVRAALERRHCDGVSAGVGVGVVHHEELVGVIQQPHLEGRKAVRQTSIRRATMSIAPQWCMLPFPTFQSLWL